MSDWKPLWTPRNPELEWRTCEGCKRWFLAYRQDRLATSCSDCDGPVGNSVHVCPATRDTAGWHDDAYNGAFGTVDERLDEFGLSREDC